MFTVEGTGWSSSSKIFGKRRSVWKMAAWTKKLEEMPIKEAVGRIQVKEEVLKDPARGGPFEEDETKEACQAKSLTNERAKGTGKKIKV